MSGYDPVNDPDDEELKVNGGSYDKKIAVGQVTIRLPLSLNPLNLIALLYGFLPWLIPIGMGVYFIITWHFIYVYGILISLVLAIINEGILKKVFNEPRPKQSANKDKEGKMKPGMPSGHVLNSTSIMVWSLLEVYNRGPGLEEHTQLTTYWLVAIFALMFPVPWARWYNMDHSAKQCAVSLVLGTLVGVGAFYFRVKYFSPAWKPWYDIMGKVYEHKPIVSAWRPPWAPTTAAPSKLLLL